MKRDMDLVRAILLQVEAAKDCLDVSDFEQATTDKRTLLYHLELMKEAGLLNAEIVPYRSGGARVSVQGLTWHGHDFLASISSQHIWESTKRVIAQRAGDASLAVIKATSEGIATALINKAL